MYDYNGKSVVVTGASSGIGRATADQLADLGAEVHALDVRSVESSAAAYVEVDLRDPASIDAGIAQLPGEIHALFNCAGLPQTFGPVDVMKVNFLGLRHLTEALVPRMSAGAAIASVASVGGLGWPDQVDDIKGLLATRTFAEGLAWVEEHPDQVDTGYRFSKGCVIVYTLDRSADLMGKGIRMNAVSPGDTRTAMTEHFKEFYGAEFWESRVHVAGRPAVPEEQANALVFLNSDAASYIAGINLIVDAGATASRMMGHVPALPGLPGVAGSR